MIPSLQTVRLKQVVAWLILSLFVLGFFTSIGLWTGLILATWFAGTQRPRRGFVWMMGFAFVPSMIGNWSDFKPSGLAGVLGYAGWFLLSAALATTPFLFYRLVSPRLPGFWSTLPLPVAAVTIQAVAMAVLPLKVYRACFFVPEHDMAGWLLPLVGAFGIAAIHFLRPWFGAVVVWIWNSEFRLERIWRGCSVAAITLGIAALYGVTHGDVVTVTLRGVPAGLWILWASTVGSIALGCWAMIRADKMENNWTDRAEISQLLQSPFTGSPLRVRQEGKDVWLVSEAGERFDIRSGIPLLLRAEDMVGSNKKYNVLYQMIGGFYDDTQRVWFALSGMDRDAYVMRYMGLLEAKQGDRVLETSVGTGLNFKYLPRNIERFGLDLSAEMLANCQANLRRWGMGGNLILGNAESLPFGDNSFDVVFHVGGINFFNDRGKAIREMIRVAKPGSLVLIADETEEHVQETYERSPVIGGFFKGRKEKVTAPVDLVPDAMEEVRIVTLANGRFYALTFRKPHYDAALAGTVDGAREHVTIP